MIRKLRDCFLSIYIHIFLWNSRSYSKDSVLAKFLLKRQPKRKANSAILQCPADRRYIWSLPIVFYLICQDWWSVSYIDSGWSITVQMLFPEENLDGFFFDGLCWRPTSVLLTLRYRRNSDRLILNVPTTIEWNHPDSSGEEITGVLDVGDLGFSSVSDTQNVKTACDFWIVSLCGTLPRSQQR